MPETQLNVRLLSHTPDPVTAIALAGRLCYSDSDILSLREGVRGARRSLWKSSPPWATFRRLSMRRSPSAQKAFPGRSLRRSRGTGSQAFPCSPSVM